MRVSVFCFRFTRFLRMGVCVLSLAEMTACAKRDWDLPVEGSFEVVVVRMDSDSTSTACAKPEGLTLTVREMKGSQTVDDDWADYMATFTQEEKPSMRLCGRKICEGNGLRWPWSFLGDDDCPISELQLEACAADVSATGPGLPRGFISEFKTNTAYHGSMEGRLSGIGWWDLPTCQQTEWEFYLKRQ